jgi:hypothetical protein
MILRRMMCPSLETDTVLDAALSEKRRRGKVHNFDADLGRSQHHGHVPWQHQLYRQFGFADTDGELGWWACSGLVRMHGGKFPIILRMPIC